MFAIAEYAKLGSSLGDEGCLPSLQCPATGNAYFFKVPPTKNTCAPVDNTVSSTIYSVG